MDNKEDKSASSIREEIKEEWGIFSLGVDDDQIHPRSAFVHGFKCGMEFERTKK